MVVHLYGQASEMDKIAALAKKYDLKLVEDCAQSHGACFGNQQTGTFGDIGCFSFYPSKNLGAFGDAGAIVTDHEEYAAEARVLRNYGSEKRYYNKEMGMNSRLDEMQAALLRVRLSHLKELETERQNLCERYLKELKNKKIVLPKIREKSSHVWHQFVIRCKERDALISYLEKKEIGTIIHYPIPPHLSEAYGYLGYTNGDFPITERYAKEILSLPLYNGMTAEEQQYIIEVFNSF